MTTPAVHITQLDNAIGVLPASSGRLLALVGVSSAGPIDTPSTYARPSAVFADFGTGPLVEAAAYALERYGRPVVIVRTASATTVGDYGTIDDSGVTGDATISETSSTYPLDDLDVVVRIVDGGTTGAAGITYQSSLDGGRTWSPVTALGTSLVFPLGLGVSFTVDTAKDLEAGDTWSCRTSAPKWTAAELGSALDALAAFAGDWGIVEIVGAVDATAFDTIEAKIAALFAAGRDVAWIGSARLPTIGESAASYRTALTSAFASKATIYGALTAGAVDLTSSVTMRTQVRPVSYAVAPREASLSEEQNSAVLSHGPLPGVSIRDALGNPRHHDEMVTPGLDDARFYVLRTWPRRPGVFVNRPRLLCPTGSDFQLLAHRRVMNIALTVLRDYFEERLSREIEVDRATGFIKESAALELEAGANARLAAALLSKPKASNAYCVIDRNENVLSTRRFSADARVVPLFYAESIELRVGFTNPALNVAAV